jgi:L-lactate dehydrogenase complex protein LldG
MSNSRDAIINRVRQAVAEGNRVGAAIPLPVRGDVGRQGAGHDAAARFCSEVTAAGGQAHGVADIDAAKACVLELVQAKSAKRVLIGRGTVVDLLELTRLLGARSVTAPAIDTLEAGTERDQFFHANLGISGVAYAIAETGTLVMASGRNEPRSLSLLPPVHIAVVGKSQLLPDLFDLFARLEPDKESLPSCFSLITGPSKTGDIELKLVTGVHGPGELHVVLVNSL